MNHSSNELSGNVTGSVIQAGHVQQVNMAPPAPSALAGLPPAIPEFTGRKAALDSISAALRPNSAAVPPPVFSLAGAAGIGKTALAIHAAHRAVAAGWFSGGQLFIDLQGYNESRTLEPDAVVSTFLTALGIPTELHPSNREGRLALYRSKLAELSTQRQALLLVLDNVSSSNQIRDLIPASPIHRILVTSRHTLGDIPGSQIMDLDALTPDEAVALITHTLCTRRPDDSRPVDDLDAVRHLVDLCGRLPLALAIAASILASDPDQRIGELNIALGERATRLDELSYDNSQSVTAAFNLSYSRLASDESRMFRLLSLNPGQQVSTEAAAALAGIPPIQARKLLTRLRTAHMLEPGRPREYHRFHDLLWLFAQQRCQKEESKENITAATGQLLTHYRNQVRNAGKKIVASERSGNQATDVTELLRIEHSNLVGAMKLADSTFRCRTALMLAVHLSWTLYHQEDALGMVRGWEAREIALENARRLTHRSGHRVKEGADVLFEYGDSIKDVKNYGLAVGYLTEALSLYSEVDDMSNSAQAILSLGTACQHEGKHSYAEEHLSAAVQLFRYLKLPQDEGVALHQLGHLAIATGQHSTARHHWEQAKIKYEQARIFRRSLEVTELLNELP